MAPTSALTLATLYLFVTSAIALPADFDAREQSKPYWLKPVRHNPHWNFPSFSFDPLPTGTTYYPTGTGTGLPGPTATGPSPTGWYQGHVKQRDTADYHLGFGNRARQWHSTGVSAGFPTAYPTGYPTAFPTASGHGPTATPNCDDIKVKRHEDEPSRQWFEGPRKAGHGAGRSPVWDKAGHNGKWEHQHATMFPTVKAAPGPTALPTGVVPTGGWY